MTAWMLDAKCAAPAAAGHDWWASEDPDDWDLAVAVCEQCPVIDACREYADIHPMPGVVAAGRPPAEPATPYLLDPGPLLQAIDQSGARIKGIGASTERVVSRARRGSRITEPVADRIAVRALGRPIDELYGYEVSA